MPTYTAQVGGDALTAGTWTPTGIPGPGDTEVIPAGSVTYGSDRSAGGLPYDLESLAVQLGGAGLARLQFLNFIDDPRVRFGPGTTVGSGAAGALAELDFSADLTNAGVIAADAPGGAFRIQGGIWSTGVHPTATPADLTNTGRIEVQGEAMTVMLGVTGPQAYDLSPRFGVFQNGGVVSVSAGSLVLDAPVTTPAGMAGAFAVTAGVLEFGASVASGQTVDVGAGGMVRIDSSTGFSGGILLGLGGSIDLPGIGLATSTAYTAASRLAITGGSIAVALQVTDSAGPGTGLRLAPDGTGGTLVTSLPAPLTVQPAGGAATTLLVTNDPNPAFDGTAAAGAAVRLQVDGGAVGSATADPVTGAYQVEPAATPGPGPHTATTTATDASGAVQAGPVQVFELPTPLEGVSTATFTSLDLAKLVRQGYAMDFLPGTAAVRLANGTLSLGPATNEAYLQRLYEGLLGRAGDTAGLAGFDQLLGFGMDPDVVAAAFVASAEYQVGHGAQGGAEDAGFVAGLYQGVLGRTPDTAGLDGWVAMLAGGATRGRVASGFVQSTEAVTRFAAATTHVWALSEQGALVSQLYATGLGRDPDQAGLQGWTDRLQRLPTAQGLADGIAGSPEFQADHAGQDAGALVDSFYRAGLGRLPDAPGALAWTTALQNGANPGSVLLGIAASSEAAATLSPPL